jgi:hypothetical protein
VREEALDAQEGQEVIDKRLCTENVASSISADGTEVYCAHEANCLYGGFPQSPACAKTLKSFFPESAIFEEMWPHFSLEMIQDLRVDAKSTSKAFFNKLYGEMASQEDALKITFEKREGELFDEFVAEFKTVEARRSLVDQFRDMHGHHWGKYDSEFEKLHISCMTEIIKQMEIQVHVTRGEIKALKSAILEPSDVQIAGIAQQIKAASSAIAQQMFHDTLLARVEFEKYELDFFCREKTGSCTCPTGFSARCRVCPDSGTCPCNCYCNFPCEDE